MQDHFPWPPATAMPPIEARALARVFEAGPDGILVADADGRIVLANRRLAELFGYRCDELVNVSVDELVPDPSGAHHAAGRRRDGKHHPARATGSGRTVTGRRRDGSEFPVELSRSSVGEGALVIATVRDGSARRRGDSRRWQAAWRRGRAFERERIAGDIHDDVIQSIYAMGLGLIAMTNTEVSKEQALTTATQDLNAVIADLRAYMRYLRSPTARDETLLQTRLTSLVGHHSRASSWTVQVDADCEPREETERQIYLVAKELISNVERHAQAASGHVGITIRGGEARLVVRDDGIGFDPEHPGGHDLRAIAERVSHLRGELHVTSAPGSGTCVEVKFPLR